MALTIEDAITLNVTQHRFLSALEDQEKALQGLKKALEEWNDYLAKEIKDLQDG